LITITSRNRSYNGTLTSGASNNYYAWIEEHIDKERISALYGGAVELIEHAKGMGIIFEDVDLRNCTMTYGNNVYEVLKFARFMDYRGNVRQVEFIYG